LLRFARNDERARRMHALLQNPSAMLDWIAVPNFLDAYK
jgi:hypothetical protein